MEYEIFVDGAEKHSVDVTAKAAHPASSRQPQLGETSISCVIGAGFLLADLSLLQPLQDLACPSRIELGQGLLPQDIHNSLTFREIHQSAKPVGDDMSADPPPQEDLDRLTDGPPNP